MDAEGIQTITTKKTPNKSRKKIDEFIIDEAMLIKVGSHKHGYWSLLSLQISKLFIRLTYPLKEQQFCSRRAIYCCIIGRYTYDSKHLVSNFLTYFNLQFFSFE